MKFIKLTTFLLVLAAIVGQVQAQGTTTAAINGSVKDQNGDVLPGATVLVVNQSNGAQYAGISNVSGNFNLLNLNVGGPYIVTISFVGYQDFSRGNVYLNLGQTLRLDVQMSETSVELDEAIVTGKRVQDFRVIDGNRTGAETVVGEDVINNMPTVNRDITDFARLTPQAAVRDDGAISIAGINNRYNSISIDGAVNNDVFGLSPTGTNGGQTGGSPISIDAIEQFQIVLAPYDVRQSGFAGAGINAVTRSGSNRMEGSAYYMVRNENLAGKTPTNVSEDNRERLAEFSAETYGFRLGGPIVKNKLFYFASVELQRNETPQPFDFKNYQGDASLADIENLANFLNTTYNYDAGGFLGNSNTLESDKVFFRLDWNINTNHKLMLRHSYTSHESIDASSSNNRNINFYNTAQFFPSTTNSTAMELKSNWEGMANNLIIGFTAVRDDRDPYGANFPAVTIKDGDGNIYFGSEPYSTANQLDQDVLTLTNNFSLYKGKHTITVGTSNEYSSSYNLFIRKNFGDYDYSSLNDFLIGQPAYQYERGYSLLAGDITGDGAKAAAEFRMLQLGLYAQDEIQFSEDFKLTAGIRLDMPVFLDEPDADAHFNNVTAPMIEAAGYDLEGAKAGAMPKSQVMFSPRIGFNWDVTGDDRTQLRGGMGIFTSRLPLVWPGGAFTNNGVSIGGVYHRSSWGDDIYFQPAWDEQYESVDFGGSDAPYGGQIDLFAEDFKFPQMFRVNLAVDQKLPWGLIGTLEGIYTKTLNNVLYYNVNLAPATRKLTGGPDDRPLFDNSRIDSDYTRVILGTNTNEGYTYNITAQLQKPFANGLTASAAYTFGRAKALNDGTSSQNSSQWRYMEQVNGLNDLDLSYSDFDIKHRITAFVSYSKEFFSHAKTTLSLYYNGQSGNPFSYVYNDYLDINQDGETYNSLIYIPENPADINLVDFVDGDGSTVTAAEQWTALNKFIEEDDYLSEHRGEYAERNAVRAPFEHIVDLKLAQDFFLDVKGRQHKLQLTLDIFNFTNLLNKDWGRKYYVPYGTYSLVDFQRFAADGTTPEFKFEAPDDDMDIYSADDSGILSSRWKAQIGIRYIF